MDKLTILAIDDQPDNLTALTAVLTDAIPGVRVVTALSGPQGIERALVEDPDVILLDIVMPGMDGYEVCRRLKADERLREIPVVILTALQTGRESRVQALELGAEAFLSKPFDEVELAAQIHAMAKIKAIHSASRLSKQLLSSLVLERTQELQRELAERQLAEEEARQSHRELAAIHASVPVALLLVDAGQRVVKLNRAAEAFAGPQIAELIGRRPGDVLHCLSATEDPRGCGYGSECGVCPIRRSVAATLTDRQKREQVEALLRIGTAAGSEERCLLVATSYLESEGEDRVLLSALDITRRKRMEKVLGESERRYRQLFEHMLDGFMCGCLVYDDWGKAVDLEYVEVNQSFTRLTGLQDVQGKRMTEVMPDVRDKNPELFEILGRVAKSGQPEQFEIDFKPLSQWYSVSAYGMGRGYVIAVFDDITERKLNESERDAMLALLRLTNSSCTTQELIRSVTAELQQWSGCEAVGIRLRRGEDFPYYVTHGFPAQFAAAENFLCARGADGETLRDGNGNPVLECMCGNVLCGRVDASKPFFTTGGSFWTNSTTRLLASTTDKDRGAHTRNRCNRQGYESVALVPLQCAGRTLGLLQFNDRRTDRITPRNIALLERAAASLAIALEQRMTQEALRTSEERYRLISENTADVIWLLDVASRKFTYVSPSVRNLRGYTAEEVMAQPLAAAFTPDSLHIASTIMSARVTSFGAGDDSVRTQVHRMDQPRRDGTVVPTEVVTTLVPDEHGRVVEILGVARDITERLEAEARLSQAQKMETVGRLAGGVAHDFNNLLTVINGYSQMLLDGFPEPDELRDAVEEIHLAGQRAAALTQQLLAFSRKQVLQPRVLACTQVVIAMRPMLARLVGEDIHVCVDLHAGGAAISADPHQLEQVVMNLVVNSRDAMPQGGKILVETAAVDRDDTGEGSRPGSYVALSVTDTGIGMDEATRQHIFEPFFTTREVGKGTGLGLSITHGIVEQSGGFIEVESEPGSGTTIRVFLPRVQQAVADEEIAEREPDLRGTGTVLVVEDQEEVRRFAAAALRSYGYRVMQAANAGEALLLCERHRAGIDLVLTDVVMPLMSGPEMAGRMRESWPEINVLFMSGYTGEAMSRQGFTAELGAILQKPFLPRELAERVREALRGTGTVARRIVVAEGEAGVRGFLRTVLEDGGYEVVEAGSAQEAGQEIRSQSADLLIANLEMAGAEGAAAIESLRQAAPKVRIMGISGDLDGEFATTAALLGAMAVLNKPLASGPVLSEVSQALSDG